MFDPSDAPAPDTGGPLMWSARMETGVATIDLQHRVLFELVQRTRDTRLTGPGIDLADLLAQLRAYAAYHFRYEEDWIREHAGQHPRAGTHQAMHAEFSERLGQLETLYKNGDLHVDSVRTFVQDWLVDHIVRQDIPMIRALRQQADHGATG